MRGLSQKEKECVEDITMTSWLQQRRTTSEDKENLKEMKTLTSALMRHLLSYLLRLLQFAPFCARTLLRTARLGSRLRSCACFCVPPRSERPRLGISGE